MPGEQSAQEMETISLEGLGLQVGRGSPVVRESYILSPGHTGTVCHASRAWGL